MSKKIIIMSCWSERLNCPYLKKVKWIKSGWYCFAKSKKVFNPDFSVTGVFICNYENVPDFIPEFCPLEDN